MDGQAGQVLAGSDRSLRRCWTLQLGSYSRRPGKHAFLRRLHLEPNVTSQPGILKTYGRRETRQIQVVGGLWRSRLQAGPIWNAASTAMAVLGTGEGSCPCSFDRSTNLPSTSSLAGIYRHSDVDSPCSRCKFPEAAPELGQSSGAVKTIVPTPIQAAVMTSYLPAELFQTLSKPQATEYSSRLTTAGARFILK